MKESGFFQRIITRYLRWALPNEEKLLIQELVEVGGERMGTTYSIREASLLASFTLEKKNQALAFLRRHSERLRARYYNRLARRLQDARATSTSRLSQNLKKKRKKALSLFQQLEIWWALRPLRKAYKVASREAEDAQNLQFAERRGLKIASSWLLQELKFGLQLLSQSGYSQV